MLLQWQLLNLLSNNEDEDQQRSSFFIHKINSEIKGNMCYTLEYYLGNGVENMNLIEEMEAYAKEHHVPIMESEGTNLCFLF